MTTCISRARFAALPLALAAAFPASQSYAQTGPAPQLSETVVSATRTPTRTDELVSDVVVVNRADLDKMEGRTLPEILVRVPGVQFSSNGGLGKTSSINIRGTEARHTILLIDGVRYGSATSGTPNWDNIPADMIERIEILKGPASALYGSEAVGGVVQIFLRKGAQGFRPYASGTLGSANYQQLAAGFTGGSGAVSYALGVQKTHDGGFSATNPRVGANYNPDRDGFDQNALNASVALQINDSWKVDAGLLYSDSVNHSDDGPGRDTRYAGLTTTARAGVEGRLLPGWRTQLRYSQSVDSNRAIVAAPAVFPSLFKTTQNQLTWQNDIDTPIGVALVGVEQLTQKVDSTTVYSVTQRTVSSYFVGLNGSQGRHSWQANLRNDSNSQFGDNSTGFAGYGFSLTPAWRVNASYGTSFVAPTFNQLYFQSLTFKGNPLLQPERGANTDIGVTWSEGGHTVKLVHFDNKIRGFIANPLAPTNVAQARIDGYTLAYDGSFGALALRASADAMNPRDALTGKRLPRRSASQVRVGADYGVGAWTFGGSVLSAGASFNDTNNLQPLAGYTTADLYADYKLNKDWMLQAKVNNLTNQQYETVLGYNQPGRTLYVTLRYQPK
ncbi:MULTISPECIES: TonB-dependent receptor domain-containing protein [Polaromonas]|uniref:TonB-dependent receptor domain-containing protein n=1 Tax=Polaromonas aquatica TaxID=332657 RepID=A0ABW1TTC7_9BURK